MSPTLAQAFNKFYYDIRILDEDAQATAARLELVRATATVIENRTRPFRYPRAGPDVSAF